jgi:hypothetical protein
MTNRGRRRFGAPRAGTSNTILLGRCDVIDLDVVSSLLLAKSAHILASEGLCGANKARGREYCINPLHYNGLYGHRFWNALLGLLFPAVHGLCGPFVGGSANLTRSGYFAGAAHNGCSIQAGQPRSKTTFVHSFLVTARKIERIFRTARGSSALRPCAGAL